MPQRIDGDCASAQYRNHGTAGAPLLYYGIADYRPDRVEGIYVTGSLDDGTDNTSCEKWSVEIQRKSHTPNLISLLHVSRLSDFHIRQVAVHVNFQYRIVEDDWNRVVYIRYQARRHRKSGKVHCDLARIGNRERTALTDMYFAHDMGVCNNMTA